MTTSSTTLRNRDLFLRNRLTMLVMGCAALAASLGACVKRVRFPVMAGGASVCAPFQLKAGL